MATVDETQIDCGLLPRQLNAGNLEGALSCLTRDACLLTPDATAVHGREAIAPVFAQLIAGQLQVRVESSKVLATGDSAVVYAHWRVTRRAARSAEDLRPTLFLRRVEGRWKLAILLLWGLGAGLPR